MPPEPPFLRGPHSFGVWQATWLTPETGNTVAGQCRILTGFAACTPVEASSFDNRHRRAERAAVQARHDVALRSLPSLQAQKAG
jgi:hypothetical protein